MIVESFLLVGVVFIDIGTKLIVTDLISFLVSSIIR